MRVVLAVLLVGAALVLVLWALRAKAETPPEPEPVRPTGPTPPAYSVVPETLVAAAPTFTVERTAEEEWRANVMLRAQAYRAAAELYAARWPGYRDAQRALTAARAMEAAAATETRAQLLFRVAFASSPPRGAGAATAAWAALVAAVRAPIDFRPTAPVVVVPGIVPLGDLTV